MAASTTRRLIPRNGMSFRHAQTVSSKGSLFGISRNDWVLEHVTRLGTLTSDRQAAKQHRIGCHLLSEASGENGPKANCDAPAYRERRQNANASTPIPSRILEAGSGMASVEPPPERSKLSKDCTSAFVN
jgi:hypothetical protein